VSQTAPATFDANPFLGCPPCRRKAAHGLVLECPVRYDGPAKPAFLTLQSAGFALTSASRSLFIFVGSGQIDMSKIDYSDKFVRDLNRGYSPKSKATSSLLMSFWCGTARTSSETYAQFPMSPAIGVSNACCCVPRHGYHFAVALLNPYRATVIEMNNRSQRHAAVKPV
jgi:hypothetical protein